jgi:hypothetical protein
VNSLATALLPVLITSIIQQNPAHYAGGDAKKVGAVLPLYFSLIDQPEVGLIYQGGGLQSMVGILAPHVTVRQAVEFAFNQWQKSIQSRLVAVAPINQ